MMRRISILLAFLMLISSFAFAEDDRRYDDEDPDQFIAAEPKSAEIGESEKNWTAHISFGAYKLNNLDKEFGSSSVQPASEIFGNDMRFYFNLGFERYLYQGYGAAGLEAALGYFQDYGKGIFRTGGTSSDTTVINIIPTKLSAVYRYSDPWTKYGVPLVPYVKFGLDYYFWWILDNNGSVSGYTDDNGDYSKGYGGTFGWHISYGLQFALDIIDPKLAQDFDSDVGVNNTYIYAEGIYANVNDFNSGSSFDFTNHHFLVGLLFEF